MCLQRPFAGQKVKDIGEWHFAYNCLLYVAIVVNCGLMVKSGQLARLLPFLSPVQVILAGVLLEHALIALKLLIEKRRSFSLVDGVFSDGDLSHEQPSTGSSVDDDQDKCD